MEVKTLGISIPSEAEYAENQTRDFSLFPADDYILEVAEVNIQKDKADIFNPGRVYDGLEVRFRPISFANGDELVDEDGNDIPDARNPLFFDWLDPSRVGLKPQPAKARKFFAYALGVELEDRIDLEDFETLVGKRLIGVVILRNKDGKRNNRIVDYRPIRRRRARSAEAAPAEAPKADVAAAAKEIFKDDVAGDDLPF